MRKIRSFVERLKKIGIEVKLTLNYPWIYIVEINGKKVKEKFYGNHGFTITFLPVRKDEELKFIDITETFKLIRKYTTYSWKRNFIKSWKRNFIKKWIKTIFKLKIKEK